MTFTDILQGAQDALFAALSPLESDSSLPTGLRVYQHVPIFAADATLPPMVIIGMMKSEDASPKGQQCETITAEIGFFYRGDARYPLMAMMNAARSALVMQEISLPGSGVQLEYPRFISAVADKVMPDGVSYLGVLTVEFEGWPG